MGVADLLGEHGHKGIAIDIAAAPGDFAPRVEHDAVGTGVAPGEPGLSRVTPVGVIRVRVTLRVTLATHTANEPCIDPELVVQGFEQVSAARILGLPPADHRAPVEARDHMADYIGFHGPLARRVSGPRLAWS